MIPTVGRIVHYRLSADEAKMINKRRQDAFVSQVGRGESGVVVHTGNSAREDDVYPLLITRVWATEPTEITCVNGQLFLDGNDSLWVTSRVQGDRPCQWSDPRG